ncbi:hypothetical protein HZB01_00360 [Candidatus Woesearchaeota archaeon]|nr:hypothetical protein [Candidatus Woesearchaeota archaeon]
MPFKKTKEKALRKAKDEEEKHIVSYEELELQEEKFRKEKKNLDTLLD